jgi:single-strand DNA-binding protein
MKSLNNVQLIGNLCHDPESKESNGNLVVRFSVATSEEMLDKATAKKEKITEWHRIVCFNKLAEIAKSYLKKGSRVYLSGKIKTSKWQNQNNEEKQITEIIAHDVIMLTPKVAEA